MNEFEIGTEVQFRTNDGVEFQGVLDDFDKHACYFTVRTKRGILGFPFEMIQMMWAV